MGKTSVCVVLKASSSQAFYILLYPKLLLSTLTFLFYIFLLTLFVLLLIVHGNNSVGGGENNLEQQNNLLLPNFVKLHNSEKHYEEGDLVELHIEESNGSVLYGVIKWIGFLPSNLPEFNAKMAGIGKMLIVYALKI